MRALGVRLSVTVDDNPRVKKRCGIADSRRNLGRSCWVTMVIIQTFLGASAKDVKG